MKIRLLSLLCVLVVLSGCASVMNGYATFHPSIVTAGVDLSQYELDRKACESSADRASFNLESTKQIHFRECLIRKGYKLMS